MKDIVLIGGGGHCISCIDVIEETGLYNIKGMLDLPEMAGVKVLNYPIIGTDNDIKGYIDNNTAFCVTIGQIGAGETLRKKIFLKALELGAYFPAIVSPNSHISKHAVVGSGSIVLSSCTVNAGVKIGANCIINSGSIIEHGAFIGNNCHISTGAVVNGDCTVGNNCFIASGVILRNGITIADNTLIGMGSVVRKSIAESGTYYGNPVRIVGKTE